MLQILLTPVILAIVAYILFFNRRRSHKNISLINKSDCTNQTFNLFDFTNWATYYDEKQVVFDSKNNVLGSIASLKDYAKDDCDYMLKAINHICNLQYPETGHWDGDYSGPHFLIPCVLFTSYFIHIQSNGRQKTVFHSENSKAKKAIIHYILNSRVTNDENAFGLWGLHDKRVQDKPFPYVLTSILYYVCLRLLDLPSTDPILQNIRKSLKDQESFLQLIPVDPEDYQEYLTNQPLITYIPSWGKFLLAVLGLYEYNSINSLFPEIWLVPRLMFCHPCRIWCHVRQLYLPMTYCYGRKLRLTEPVPQLIIELRNELYGENAYETIDWADCRNRIALTDSYTPHSRLLNVCYCFLNAYEKIHIPWFRRLALDKIYRHVCADDEFTQYTSIAPISKSFNMLVRSDRDGIDSLAVEKHLDAFKYFWWVGPDGQSCRGTNGSQFWDTAFYVQALLESFDGLSLTCLTPVEKEVYTRAGYAISKAVFTYFINQQAIVELKNYDSFYRHPVKGGFPFSTKLCGWVLSDCTAEALSVLCTIYSILYPPKQNSSDESSKFLLHDILSNNLDDHNNQINKSGDYSQQIISRIHLSDAIFQERMYLAVDCLLNYQNKNGGVASYEKIRGSALLEMLDPAEMFANIMVEHAYVECTSACYKGLQKFHQIFPNYRSKDIELFLDKSLDFIVSNQGEDGSWEGSWGVCFTYAGWFALEALSSYSPFIIDKSGLGKKCNTDLQANDVKNIDFTHSNFYRKRIKREVSVIKGCKYLVSIQREDGGWGEDFTSCPLRQYIPSQRANIVQTSWALLGLMAVRYARKDVIDKGIKILKESQLPNGDWPVEPNTGVFNKTTAIIYSNYNKIFPFWALSRYKSIYGS